MTGFLRAVLEVYTAANMWKDMALAVASGSIAVGGGIGLFILFWAAEYVIMRRQRRNQYIKTGDPLRPYKQRHFRCGINILQTLFKCLFVIGLGITIWVAGAVAGFNPYSTATAMLVMGVVVTYMFAGPLGAWGTSLALVWDNQLAIGQHWEFHGAGPGWDGVISGIYTFEVEMMHKDEKDGHVEIISVPISNFFNMMRKSDMRKAQEAKKERWAVPAYEYEAEQKKLKSPAMSYQYPLEVRVALPPGAGGGGGGGGRSGVNQRRGFHSSVLPELHE